MDNMKPKLTGMVRGNDTVEIETKTGRRRLSVAALVRALGTGEKGADGADGPAGKDGERGVRGDTGAVLAKGDKGAQGPQGPAGRDGEIGPKGDPGPAGEVVTVRPSDDPELSTYLEKEVAKLKKNWDGGGNAPTLKGRDGKDGTDGTNGTNGTDGRDGLDGLDGATGATGPAGADGSGLPDGGTVGQIVVKQSSVDGDADWADPSGGVGPTGPTGPTGADGTDGTDGTNGTNGTDGTNGATGPIGPTGSNGGTDIVLDTTPQLGGELDAQGNDIKDVGQIVSDESVSPLVYGATDGGSIGTMRISANGHTSGGVIDLANFLGGTIMTSVSVAGFVFNSTPTDNPTRRDALVFQSQTELTNAASNIAVFRDQVTDNKMVLRQDGSLNVTAGLGLHGKTDVPQHTATGDTTGFVRGLGTGARSDSTYQGSGGSGNSYTVGDIVTALKDAGILA